MRKPVPYKKLEPENKKTINKKKIIILVVCEIIVIALSLVTTAIISLVFKVPPFISAIVSGVILIVLTVFISREFLTKKN